MGMLVRVIHWLPALAGLLMTALLVPASAMIGRKLSTVRKRLVAKTDARVKLCSEVATGTTWLWPVWLVPRKLLSCCVLTYMSACPNFHNTIGIKAIKLYAWEQPYTDRINALRAEELVEIRRTGVLTAWYTFIAACTPLSIGRFYQHL